MKRRYGRTVLACLLAAVLTGTIVTGCGKGNTAGDGNASAKGRYIEEEMELPLTEGEEVMNLDQSTDGAPLVFADGADGQLFRYEYQDGQWERTSLEWIGRMYEGKEIIWQEVHETQDGAQVALGIEAEEGKTYVARAQKEQEGEDLVFPYLNQQTDYGYPMLTTLQIGTNGTYWMQDMYQQKIVVISPDSGEVLQEIPTVQAFSNEQKSIFNGGNGSMAINTEEGVFTIYDESFQKTGILKDEQRESTQMCRDGESWYVISEAGITRLTAGNDMREVIMDGSLGSMGSAQNRPVGIIAGTEKDFYVLYRQEKTYAGKLVHYTYDTEAAAVPDQTLRVFGVSDNATVQEAVLGFQKLHPDVKVEFQTSGTEGVTSDDIRTLNTELLSGNGADVLLLDGLPAESYVEKGILEDLTDVAERFLSQGDYLETMIKDTVQKDGKIYGIPVRFSVPIQFGSETVKRALDSLDNLSAYMTEHPDASVFGVIDKTYVRDFLFQIFQEEIVEADGKINQEKMARLLELEEQIAVNANSQLMDEYTFNSMEMGSNGLNIFQQGMFSHPVIAAIKADPETVMTTRISAVMNMMIPYALMREQGLSPESVHDFYVPHGIVGINQNTAQPDLAKEFVEYLFSAEVQGAQLDDGLPVLQSALDMLPEETNTATGQNLVTSSSWNIDGYENLEVEAGYPTAEEVEGLVEMCAALENPAKQDGVIWGIYQEEANQYLRGKIDAGTAAKNIAQKVDTYLAE